MEPLYQPYLRLTAAQRKLLCFLAYIGKTTDEKLLSIYQQVEDLKADQLKKLMDGLRAYYESGSYYYRSEYQLSVSHVAPLILYLLEAMPEWKVLFDKFFKKHQSHQAMLLMYKVECCLAGKPIELSSQVTAFREADILMPLASDERFMPLMTEMLDINRFVQNVVVYQIENDIEHS